MARRKERYRSIRLGEAETGMSVWYLNDLHLPPILVSITEVGEIQQGSFQKYQDLRFMVPAFNRIDCETVMESGCERLLMER